MKTTDFNIDNESNEITFAAYESLLVMEIIIYLLSMFAISFLIKESSGPFDLMSKLRNKLMTNKYVGVFFYKLFSCYYCVGCHGGWIVYLLANEYSTWKITTCILWMLCGGAISLLLSSVFEKLQSYEE